MTMIDPAIVPQRTLYTGAKMPAVGMGTFGSDHADADAVSASVAGALRVGYRSFDCAACYGNEDMIGKIFADAFAEGIVKREVIRVVTPGTTLNTQALDETKNNYIMSVVYLSNRFGIAIADVTTGDFMVTEVENIRKLLDEIYKFSPAELFMQRGILHVRRRYGRTEKPSAHFRIHTGKTGILMTSCAPAL